MSDASHLHLLKISAIQNSIREGLNLQFLQAQDRHPAPARSSRLSKKQPRWKKTRPEPQPGANVSAVPPVVPPCDPRASPDHPTWWVVPPGTHHSQGGKKNPAHFGRWVPTPKPKS
jgi:hypothetical protein